MSKAFMSESEEEDAGGDFSASEDEWLPEKAASGKKGVKKSAAATGISDESDTDSEDSLAEEAVPKKNQKRPKTASSRRKSAGVAGAKNLNTSKANARSSKRSATKQPGEESDSSGDEYLVDPTKLDFNSKFFDKLAQAPTSMFNQTTAPQFAGAVGHLSDSSEDESDGQDEQRKKNQPPANGESAGGKQLIAKINQMSQAYANFQDFTNTLEMAKNHLKSVTSQANQTQSADQGSGGGTAIDVSNLLALGEANSNVEEEALTVATGKRKKAPAKGKNSKKPVDSDSDWEEVEEQEQPSTSSATPQSVQITVAPEAGAAQRKRKCTEVDVEACIKRMINREKRDAQLVLHKMTIIMGIAHGNFTNSVLNDPSLLAIGNVLMPSERCYPKGPTDKDYLRQIMNFFREIITVKSTRTFSRPWKHLSLQEALRLQLLSQTANCKRDYVLMFIILLRSIGIHCRMVVSLQVAPKNVPTAELLKVSAANGGKKVKVSEKTKDTIAKEHDYEPTKKSTSSRKRKAPTVAIPQLDGADEVSARGRQSSSKGRSKQQTRESQQETVTIPTAIGISPRKTRGQRLEEKQRQQDPSKASKAPSKQSKTATTLPTQGSEPSSSKMIRRDYAKSSPNQAPNIEPSKPSKPSKSTPKVNRSPSVKEAKRSQPIPQPSPGAKIVKIERFSAKTRGALDRRVLSTDDEHTPGPSGTNKKGLRAVNMWVEAYAEKEKRWMSIDVLCGVLLCAEHIASEHTTHPILYVLAWNNDGSIKDVSARYCSEFVNVQQKLRIMQQWIDDTLLQFRPERSARDIAEDRELDSILEARPLPKTIAEYKCHPYFALKRHLLKFEAIYPPDAPTLGFTSNKEPVYARECVHTLHSREIWLKQARTVKLYESPYKIVAGRPKYDRSSGQMLPSQPVELFGVWQTEEYDPPTAENGIVPRNAYGNVELFKPCMLPKKTVHLRLPALNRICKKLRIDCAQAVTGFDFHGGSSHPVYDGFVVCEEYRDLVVDAWHEEQAAEEQRAREKYEKRVYGNWKRLIKGLLIRQRLQHKYNFDNLST